LDLLTGELVIPIKIKKLEIIFAGLIVPEVDWIGGGLSTR
jgi:hypothetical protein